MILHNKSQDLIYIISKIDLGINFDINSAYKLARFIMKMNSKMHKPKIYNIIIGDFIYRNK